jgi:hypothetical protein
MIKKLLISVLIALLISLGTPWKRVSIAYAGPNNLVFLASPSYSVLNHPSAAEYINTQATLADRGTFINQKVNSLLQSIKQTSTFYKTQAVRDVTITLFGPGHVDLTKPLLLLGTLKDASSGAGIPNMPITISSGGFYLGQTRTDDQGNYSVKITKVLRAGDYLLDASFKGAHLLAPVSTTTLVQVLPATVQIQTVPALAGITFQMDGRQFTSGSDGSVTIRIDQAGQYQLDVLLDKFHDPSQQVEFGRWASDSYQPSREVNVPAENFIQVGLNVFHKVTFKFVDLDGYPVDPARISSISIRSVQGDVFDLKPGDTPWVPASRTARRSSGLDVTELLYSVNSVSIDGSNVVNTAQQRFLAQADDTWTITLLLYSLKISARDGLFASPIGKSVDLIFPNGQIKNYPLNPSGNIEIHTLARGIYHISLVGVKGLGTTTPVALSRNQVVKLNIVTQLDIGITVAAGLGFAIGLVLYGRPQLINSLFRRRHPVSSRIGWTSEHEN